MPLYQRSLMDEEEEITELETENQLQREEPDLAKEEQTWKKRYGDLRRVTQQKDNEVSELKRQLTQSTSQTFRMPDANDEQALEEWITAYPDIARVVTTLANKQAKQAMEAVDQRVRSFEDEKRQNEVETAVRKLSEAHPDFFDEIRVDPEFDAWIRSKSKRMQDALFSDESVTDWQSAADVITLYKMEKGIVKKKEPAKDTRKETVREVQTKTRQNPPSLGGEWLFSESQIGKMDSYTYERNEEVILEALRSGKVLMDVTGAAR